MKKLSKIKGACVPTALWYISQSGTEQTAEEAITRMCLAHGFKPAEGMYQEDWVKVLKLLSIKIRAVTMEACHLSTFLKKHKVGLYLVVTYDHMFVVDAGVIFDPRNKKPPGLKRTIVSAWKVLKD